MLLHKIIKQWISITLCSTILFPLMLQPVYGEDTSTQGVEGVLLSSQEGLLYSRFLEETAFVPYEGETLKFDAREAYLSERSEGKEIEAAGVKAIQVAYKERALFEFELTTEGLYEVLVHYQVANANLLPTKVAFSINDEVPYRELKNILFENEWITDEEVSYDRYGNEIAATPRKELKWQEKAVMDGAYRYSDALLLPFGEGINTLELSVVEGEIAIASFELRKRNALPSYESQEVSGEEVLVIEGEAIHSRSDSSIRANGEYDVNLSPYSSTKKVLNILDGGSFKKSGQRVSYEVEVKKAGYYYLAMNYRQVDRVDYPVFVDVAINGEIPNEFLKNYPLGYGTKYQRKTLKTANEPIAVYLEEGVSTLSLTLSVEPMTASIEKVEMVMDEINALALEINKLTGGKADKYRDFDLADYIPGVKENLQNWSSRLEQIYEELAVYSQVEGTIGAFSSIKIAMASLDKLAQKPDELPARMNEFSNGTTSVIQYLANTVQVIDNNILSVDRIYLFQDEELLPKEKSIFVKFIEAIKRFFYSFMDQSYSVKNTSEDHLQVWVNRSRQYVEIMQKMVDENFTKETGIQVDLSIMPDQNKLILANAAGEAPDLAQSIHFALPHDLAIRGALVDVTKYEGYDEVISHYPEGLVIPAMIGDSVYSIPETMNFWVMYYRSDIFSALDLPIPDTMEEVTDILPELQRRGMSFYYPSAGMPGIKYFAATMPLIYQHGGRFYGDYVSKTTINEEAALNGLRELTDLFLIFNAPYDVPSFYQHFRDGSIPIGIAEYSMYNLLLNAAPEIADSWDIALFPGVEAENGEVSRYTAGAAESSVIFESSERKEDAWEYMKWWNSVETQVEFGYTLQTTYGKEFLWNTANMDAFEQLPWQSNHKDVIREQAEWMVEAPRVPGSYMLERELSNLYNAVVVNGEQLRTAVDNAVKRINRETERKLEEFGYMKDGVMVKEYLVPSIEMEVE